MQQTAYSLKVGDEQVAEVTVEAPSWLPVRPKVNKQFLRSVATEALLARRTCRNGVTAGTCIRIS